MISNIKYPISSAIACSFVGSIGSSFIGIGPVASASYGFVTASTFLFFNYVSKDLIKNDSYRSRASLIAGNAVACGTLAFTATPITVPTTLILLITSIGGVLILEAFRTFHQNYQTQNKSTNNLELDRGSDDDDVWNSEEDGASSSDGEELPTNLISAKSPQSVKVDSAKEIEQASLKVWILAQIEKAKKSNEDEVDINADRVDHLNDFFSDLAQKGIISYYVEERSKWVTVKFTQPPKEISLEEIDKVVIDKIYKEIEEAKELKEKKTALLAAHGLSYHYKQFYLNHLKKEGVIVDYIHRYNNSATVIFEA